MKDFDLTAGLAQASDTLNNAADNAEKNFSLTEGISQIGDAIGNVIEKITSVFEGGSDSDGSSEFPPDFREGSEGSEKVDVEFINAADLGSGADTGDIISDEFADLFETDIAADDSLEDTSSLDDMLDDFLDDYLFEEEVYTPDYVECSICDGDGILYMDRESAPNFTGDTPTYYDVPVYCDYCSGTGFIYM
ncbi:MAG: hypothetical protein LIO44_06665 [Eubacterium sp.]|nr:hypothetical protein [Eubacterium sp.]